MATSTKILTGAALSALLGWLSYGAVCAVDGNRVAAETNTAVDNTNAGDEVTAPPAQVPAATVEEAKACQSDFDSLMKSKTILFQTGSAYIAPASADTLKELATKIKECAGTQIEVQGHTDLTGNAETNQNISQARAQSVVAELLKLEVPAGQLTAKGYGSTQPLVNALTSAANTQNRRTVLVVSTKADPAAAPAGGQ
jgi:OmpA-OmpF porin, OOP family